MQNRIVVVTGLVVLFLGVAACSGSSSSSKNTTTTSNQGFEVQTPEGQASISFSGSLPPNWPSDFPVPSGAKAAGSGSLGNASETGFVGVYSTSTSAEDTYNFYRDNSDLQVTSSSSIGSGNTYIGTVQFDGPSSGSVVVLPYNGETLIVVFLSQSEPGTTVASATSGSIEATTPAP